MRAKLQISGVTPSDDGTQEVLEFFAVTGNPFDSEGLSDDNTYAKWSPSGSLKLTVANPALLGAFAVGEKYYVDFTPEGAVASIVEPVETTWLERLTAEGMELEDRIDKLSDFIENSSTFAGLDDPERDRLLRQRVAMQAYHGILIERLEAAAPAVEASEEAQGGTEPEA
jgi:hypothetical protein